MSQLRIIDCLPRDDGVERSALIAGLHASPASIPPKYFYDAQGCALFAAICELDEYYPTRTEQAIFAQYRDSIAQVAGRGRQLIDLGAGDGRKAQQWFGALQPSRYVAVDIARVALEGTLSRITAEYPALEVMGVLADFTRGLALPEHALSTRSLFFYPGSSIGNFAPDDALQFLATIREQCKRAGQGGGLLIGVDTKKDPQRLEAAYDDALGLTAAFNRNVLRHINALIGSDFDPRSFVHRGFYNAGAGRVEMHLEAATAQHVRIDGRVRTYEAGERIATEHSYKYAPREFEALLHRAGFDEMRCWTDDDGAFAVFFAR